MTVRSRRWLANSVVVTTSIAAFVLVRFNPATSQFYPRCPVFFWLHIYCPGCGGTRALAALLHGKLWQAMHWNPMVVSLLPFAAVFAAVAYTRAIRAGAFVWPEIPDVCLKALLVLIGVFTMARNMAML
jgi:hypothetical protein